MLFVCLCLCVECVCLVVMYGLMLYSCVCLYVCVCVCVCWLDVRVWFGCVLMGDIVRLVFVLWCCCVLLCVLCKMKVCDLCI